MGEPLLSEEDGQVEEALAIEIESLRKLKTKGSASTLRGAVWGSDALFE